MSVAKTTADPSTVTVVIPGTDIAVAWSAGVFAGDPATTTVARALAATGAIVELTWEYPEARCSADTAAGAAAAMLAACGGRGVILGDTVDPAPAG